MSANSRIEIQPSKIKIILLSIGAAGFVLAGFWILSLPAALLPSYYSVPFLKNGLGIVCIIFFGLCGVIGFKKIFDNKPALAIDEKGIDIGNKFISWTDVTRIEVVSRNQFNADMKFLVIFLKNPEQYIQNELNKLKQKSMLLKYKLVGSPICVPHTGLKVNFDQLKNILDSSFSKYGNNSKSIQPTLQTTINHEIELKKPSAVKRLITWIAGWIVAIVLGLMALAITQPDKFEQLKESFHNYFQNLPK